MWKHIRWALTAGGLLAGCAYWLATTSIAQTIEGADGYFYQNLQWLGWRNPPDALASQATNHAIIIVSVVVGIIGALAFASWVVERLLRRLRPAKPQDLAVLGRAAQYPPQATPEYPGMSAHLHVQEVVNRMVKIARDSPEYAAYQAVIAILATAEDRLARVRRRITYAERAESQGGASLDGWLRKVRSSSQGVSARSLSDQREKASFYLSRDEFGAYCAAIDELEELDLVAKIANDITFSPAHISRNYLSRARKARTALETLVRKLTEKTTPDGE